MSTVDKDDSASTARPIDITKCCHPPGSTPPSTPPSTMITQSHFLPSLSKNTPIYFSTSPPLASAHFRGREMLLRNCLGVVCCWLKWPRCRVSKATSPPPPPSPPLPCLCQSPALPGWTTSFCFHLANLQSRSIAKLGFQIFRKCQTTHHRHQSKINFVDSKGKAHVYIIIIKDTAGLTIDSRESSVYLYIEQINWDLNQYLMELLNMLKL